jgi:hypothetical protein
MTDNKALSRMAAKIQRAFRSWINSRSPLGAMCDINPSNDPLDFQRLLERDAELATVEIDRSRETKIALKKTIGKRNESIAQLTNACAELRKRLRTLRQGTEDTYDTAIVCDVCGDVADLNYNGNAYDGCDACLMQFCEGCSEEYMTGGLTESNTRWALCSKCTTDENLPHYTSTDDLL